LKERYAVSQSQYRRTLEVAQSTDNLLSSNFKGDGLEDLAYAIDKQTQEYLKKSLDIDINSLTQSNQFDFSHTLAFDNRKKATIKLMSTTDGFKGKTAFSIASSRPQT
jgi:hypothetical protein